MYLMYLLQDFAHESIKHLEKATSELFLLLNGQFIDIYIYKHHLLKIIIIIITISPIPPQIVLTPH